MLVGPSMAPMMAIEDAWLSGKCSSVARISVAKMPNCPAAPISAKIGCESSGRKSINAPIPMKMNNGKSSVLMPISFKMYSMPPG